MPTPRRAKKVETGSSSNRNRILSIIGIIVILSMSLTLVIQPGGSAVTPGSQQDTPTPRQLTNDELIATINALQATSAAATPLATVPVATVPVTPTLALTPTAAPAAATSAATTAP